MISRLFAVLLLFLSPALPADTLTGKVVRVLDGDTVEVLDIEANAHRIRLAGIDAPETGQAFGTKANRRLIELAAGEVVDVEFDKRDRYRRIVGKLIADGRGTLCRPWRWSVQVGATPPLCWWNQPSPALDARGFCTCRRQPRQSL